MTKVDKWWGASESIWVLVVLATVGLKTE